MAHGNMRLFFAHYRNKVDHRDDGVIKIAAKTKPAAKRLAEQRCSHRFTLGRVMTRKQLRRWDPEWHALLWGQEPSLVQGVD